MKTYIGIKVVTAEEQPEFVEKAGGAVAFHGRDGYRVQYGDGYVSWSPQETFEAAYIEVDPGDAGRIEDWLRAECRRLKIGELHAGLDRQQEIASRGEAIALAISSFTTTIPPATEAIIERADRIYRFMLSDEGRAVMHIPGTIEIIEEPATVE